MNNAYCVLIFIQLPPHYDDKTISPFPQITISGHQAARQIASASPDPI